MASIYDLKPRFQQLLRGPTGLLYRMGVTANQVTLLAMLVSIAVGVVIAVFIPNPVIFLLLPVFLFIRMALNAIDGMLAREFQQKSRLGAILNELGDVVSDAALYLPFALIPGVNGLWVTSFAILAVISEMAGVLGQVIGASRRYDGPMGKSDRAFVFGVLGLLIGLEVPLFAYLNAIFIILNVLVLFTILNRARRALVEVNV